MKNERSKYNRQKYISDIKEYTDKFWGKHPLNSGEIWEALHTIFFGYVYDTIKDKDDFMYFVTYAAEKYLELRKLEGENNGLLEHLYDHSKCTANHNHTEWK